MIEIQQRSHHCRGVGRVNTVGHHVTSALLLRRLGLLRLLRLRKTTSGLVTAVHILPSISPVYHFSLSTRQVFSVSLTISRIFLYHSATFEFANFIAINLITVKPCPTFPTV